MNGTNETTGGAYAAAITSISISQSSDSVPATIAVVGTRRPPSASAEHLGLPVEAYVLVTLEAHGGRRPRDQMAVARPRSAAVSASATSPS